MSSKKTARKARIRREKGTPWFRSFDDSWYVTPVKGGNPVALRDTSGRKIKGQESEAEAWAATKLAKTSGIAPAPAPSKAVTAGAVIDAYLEFLNTKREASSYRLAKRVGTEWLKFVGDQTPACDLEPYHLSNWIEGDGAAWKGKESVYKSSNTINRAMGIMVTAFHRAAKKGTLRDRNGNKIANPFAAIDRPKLVGRATFIEEAQRALMLDWCARRNPALGDLLFFMLESGCRPEEASIIEAAHCAETPEGTITITLPAFKEDGSLGHKTGRKTGNARIIECINPEACALLRKLIATHPEGKLFRTKTGVAWCRTKRASYWKTMRDGITNEKIKEFVSGGMDETEAKKRAGWVLSCGPNHSPLVLYSTRHTWAKNALLAGLTLYQVAEMLGNSYRVCEQYYASFASCRNKLRAVAIAALTKAAPAPAIAVETIVA